MEPTCEMQYNFLGNTGLQVSSLCLGAMTFAEIAEGHALPATPKDVAMQMLNYYAELGGNFIDTADMYTIGQSETVGTFLKNVYEARWKRNKFL